MSLDPYLMFDGAAKEVMQFYHGIFGGELTMMTYGETFPDTPTEYKDRIMHASLKNDFFSVMASDTPPQMTPATVGNNINLCLVGSDLEQLTTYFNKLAEGGKINMPLEKQFWGDTFGTLTDKYGIPWMVDVGPSES